MTVEETDVNFWMKIVGSVITFVVVGMMSWMTFTLQDMSVRMAVLETSVKAIQETPQPQVITLSEINSLIALRDQRITRNEEWLSNLSRRLSDVENDIRSDGQR